MQKSSRLCCMHKSSRRARCRHAGWANGSVLATSRGNVAMVKALQEQVLPQCQLH